jgi:hypothetical protein
MKTMWPFVLGVLLASACTAESASVRLAVDLSDGSRVIGIPDANSVRIRTEFGELVIPLSQIDLATWNSDRETVVIRFHNGDVLTGGIVPEPLKLSTLFGGATISMEHVTSLETIPIEKHAGPPLLDGLVAYYPFDSTPAGDKVINVVQDHHHGQVTGGLWTEDGVRGGAFQFSQSGDAIEIPDDPAFQLQQLTLCAWVLPQDNKHSTWRGIVTKTSSGSWSNGFGLARYPGKPDAHFFVNYYSAETVSNPIPDGKWSHLAASYDGRKMVLYVDGVRVSETVATNYGGPIRYGPEPILIGAAPSGYHWIGKIDEVMIFGRVLGDREVERIYQRTQ